MRIPNFPSGSKILFWSAFGSLLVSFSYLWRWPIGSWGSINFLDTSLSFFIFISLIQLAAPARNHGKKFYLFIQKNSRLLFCLMAILLLSLAGALKNPLVWDGLGLWKSFFLLPVVFSVFLAFWKSRFSWKIDSFFVAIWGAGCFLALGAFYFWSKNLVTYDQRLTFVFSSPNQLALSLAPALFIGLERGFFYFSQKRAWGWLFGASSVLLVFCLWQTRSLSFFLFFPFSLIVFYFLKNHPGWTRLLWALFVSSQIFLIFNWSEIVKISSYQRALPPTSFDSRVAIWEAAEKILEKNWLGGIGLGNFQKVYLDYQVFFPPYPEWAAPHSHNLFSHLWLELGSLFFIFWLISLWLFFSIWQKQKGFSETFLFLILYFLLLGSVEATFWKNDLALIFWFSLLVGQIQTEKPTAQAINEK